MRDAAPKTPRPLPPVFFMDIEASGLLCGYPIEIAWVDCLGHGESHLIRPAEKWLNSPNRFLWSVASQTIHGITPTKLQREGRSHRQVAKRVLDVLGRTGAVVVSDGPEFDRHWLDVLLDAADSDRHVEIQHVESVNQDAILPLTRLLPPGVGRGDPAIQRIIDMGNRILNDVEHRFSSQVREHRALPDAMRMYRQWTEIRHEVARRIEEESTP